MATGPRHALSTRSCCESRWLGSHDQRRALVLAVFYGFTAREISDLDGVPLGTVKARIRSAMVKLRSQLKVSDDR